MSNLATRNLMQTQSQTLTVSAGQLELLTDVWSAWWQQEWWWAQDLRYDTIQYNMIQYHTMDTIQYGTIWYETTRFDTILYDDTISYDTLQWNSNAIKKKIHTIHKISLTSFVSFYIWGQDNMRDCIDLSVQKDILKMNVHKKLVSVHLQISLLYIYIFFFSFMFGGLDFSLFFFFFSKATSWMRMYAQFLVSAFRCFSFQTFTFGQGTC